MWFKMYIAIWCINIFLFRFSRTFYPNANCIFYDIIVQLTSHLWRQIYRLLLFNVTMLNVVYFVKLKSLKLYYWVLVFSFLILRICIHVYVIINVGPTLVQCWWNNQSKSFLLANLDVGPKLARCCSTNEIKLFFN